MRTARLRLRSVRFKDGRAPLRVIYPPEPVDLRRDIKADIADTLEDHGPDVAGFVFMAWGSDHTATTVQVVTPDSGIPPIMVPDFVRERLRADWLERFIEEATDGGSGEADDDEF